MNKFRVWWIPQVGHNCTFYIPVQSVEEGKKILDLLAAYDLFQLCKNIKPDFCNTGGLQIYDEEENEYVDWFLETEDVYFEDVDDYCESDLCDKKDELENFKESLFSQIDYSKLN